MLLQIAYANLTKDLISKLFSQCHYSIVIILTGMGPDYRLLVRQARKIAQQYQRNYLEPIPTTQLVQRVAAVMQEYTQSGSVQAVVGSVPAAAKFVLAAAEFVLDAAESVLAAAESVLAAAELCQLRQSLC